MKRALFALLILCLFAGLLLPAAETIQVPVTLYNDGVDRGVRLFNIALPLKRGDLKDLKNLQLSDADGAEIPIQSEVISRYLDDSLEWVRISGLLPMGSRRYRKIFVEYGSRILHSEPRGIVCAESGGRMLIDAGKITAEFDMKKFALPEKIMCDGTDAGKFAPLPVGGGEAKLFIEESGSRHMVLRIEVPSSPEYGYLRVHFFYGIPEFEVEYHAVDAKSTPVEFISRRRYALDVKRSKEVCRYRFGFGMARVEAAPPLTAVLPRWHLERTGIIPAENLLPQELRDIEKTLLKQIASTPDKFAPGMLLEAFLRTGELKLFAMTVKGEKGIKSARHRNILRAHGVKCEVLEEIAPAETLPGHGVVSTAALIKFLNGKTGQSRDFIRLLDILCSGFDPVSGSWYDRIDILNGAASTEYVPFALRLQALKLVLENSLSNFGGKFDGIAACGLERLAVDAPGGGAVREYDIFTVLALAGEFYRRHPQLADEFSGEEFLVRRSAINPAAVKLKIRNGFSAKAVPRDSDASLRLSGFAAGGGITFAAKDGEVLPGYFAGKDNIYQVKLPKSGAEMMYRSHKASEIGVFPLPGYEFRFRIAGMGAELPQAQLCGFALYPAPGVKSFKIRLLPADPNESCLVVLISPEGRRFRQMVCGVACYTAAGTAPLEFPVTEAGAWQMFIHAPDGGVVVASDDVELVIKRPDLH